MKPLKIFSKEEDFDPWDNSDTKSQEEKITDLATAFIKALADYSENTFGDLTNQTLHYYKTIGDTQEIKPVPSKNKAEIIETLRLYFWELVRNRVVIPGMNIYNPDWPNYRVTPIGYNMLQTGEALTILQSYPLEPFEQIESEG